MCRLLTVTCQRHTAYGDIISDHSLTFNNIKMPCEQPDSVACQAGVSKMKDFQNPPMQCAGITMGLQPGTELCKAVCAQALWKYGVALWRVNTGGTRKRRASLCARLREWLLGRKEAQVKQEVLLVRLGAELGGRAELI